MIFPRCCKEQSCLTFRCASFSYSIISCTTFGFVATMAAMAALPMCAGVQYCTKGRECSYSRICLTTFGFVATMAAMAALPMCAGVQTDNSACSNNGQNRRVYGETYNALVRNDIHKQGNRHTCGWERQFLLAGRARGSRQVRYNWATSLTTVFRRTTMGHVAGHSTEKRNTIY